MNSDLSDVEVPRKSLNWRVENKFSSHPNPTLNTSEHRSKSEATGALRVGIATTKP